MTGTREVDDLWGQAEATVSFKLIAPKSTGRRAPTQRVQIIGFRVVDTLDLFSETDDLADVCRCHLTNPPGAPCRPGAALEACRVL